MGIYTDGIVYGIRILTFVDDEAESNIIFERKDDVKLSLEKLKDAKLFYETLMNKNNLLFSTYIEYSSTYGEGVCNELVFKTWSIISLDSFLEIISTCNQKRI